MAWDVFFLIQTFVWAFLSAWLHWKRTVLSGCSVHFERDVVKEGEHAGHKWWKCVGMYRAIEHCGQLVYEELFSLRSCAALKSIRNKKVGVVWVWEFCVGDRKRIGFGNLGRKGCEEIYWANEWHNIQTVNHSVFSTQSETCTYSEGGGSQSSFAFHLHFITARNIKAYRISLGD